MERIKDGPFWYTSEQLKMVERLGGTHWIVGGLLVIPLSKTHCLSMAEEGQFELGILEWAT